MYESYFVAFEMLLISMFGAWSLFTARLWDFYPLSSIPLSCSEKPRFSLAGGSGSGLDDLLVKLPLLLKPLSSPS